MDESSSSEFMITKKDLKTNKSSTKDDFQRQGRWNSEQNLKYLVFLSFNLSKFQCKKKRMFRLYKPLSKFISTRNSEQCRSHHRKLLQRFKCPKNIILNLEQQFDKDEIERIKEKSVQKLNELPIPQKKNKIIEKQDVLSERMEQKKRYENQNIKQKTTLLNNNDECQGSKKNTTHQFDLCSLNLRCPDQIAIMNYQALNWLNQVYMANYNFLYNQSCFNFYPNFPSPSQISGNE